MAHLQQVQFMWYEHFWQVSVYIRILAPDHQSIPGETIFRRKFWSLFIFYS